MIAAVNAPNMLVAMLLIATNLHSLFWCGSLSKVVKINVKPAVDFFMDGFVLGAEFFRCHTILESLPTCSSVHHIIISYMSGYIIIYDMLSHIVYINEWQTLVSVAVPYSSVPQMYNVL